MFGCSCREKTKREAIDATKCCSGDLWRRSREHPNKNTTWKQWGFDSGFSCLMTVLSHYTACLLVEGNEKTKTWCVINNLCFWIFPSCTQRVIITPRESGAITWPVRWTSTSCSSQIRTGSGSRQMIQSHHKGRASYYIPEQDSLAC